MKRPSTDDESGNLRREYIRTLCKELLNHKLCVGNLTARGACRFPINQLKTLPYSGSLLYREINDPYDGSIMYVAKQYIDHITLYLHLSVIGQRWEDVDTANRKQLAVLLIRAVRGLM